MNGGGGTSIREDGRVEERKVMNTMAEWRVATQVILVKEVTRYGQEVCMYLRACHQVK